MRYGIINDSELFWLRLGVHKGMKWNDHRGMERKGKEWNEMYLSKRIE